MVDIIEQEITMTLRQFVFDIDEDDDDWETKVEAVGDKLAREWRSRANLHAKKVEDTLEVGVIRRAAGTLGPDAVLMVDPALEISVSGAWEDA